MPNGRTSFFCFDSLLMGPFQPSVYIATSLLRETGIHKCTLRNRPEVIISLWNNPMRSPCLQTHLEELKEGTESSSQIHSERTITVMTKCQQQFNCFWLMKILISNVPLQPRRSMVSWVPTEEGWPEVWGRQLSLPALSSWDLMWSILSRSGVPNTERYRAFGEGPEAFLQEDDPRASPMKTGWRS